jgi:hypothetical protein
MDEFLDDMRERIKRLEGLNSNVVDERLDDAYSLLLGIDADAEELINIIEGLELDFL